MGDESNGVALSERYKAAFALAFEVHGTTSRKTTSIPYLAHVISVSALTFEYGGDEECAIAGLLHDAVEDSEDGAAMLARIRDGFGARVAGVVEACSDVIPVPGQSKPPFAERKQRYLDHLSDADGDSLLVSACDKLHNGRAIVTDLREMGNGLWERFRTRSAADQLWYYQSLSDAFAGRINASLDSALRDVVVDMTTLTSELGAIPEERRAWLSHSPDHREWLLSGPAITVHRGSGRPHRR